MSFVLLKKNLKKVLLTSILTLFLGAIFVPTAYAYSAGDFGKDVNDLFKTGQQGLSFTQYSGQLAQLDKAGYDQSLVANTDIRQFVIKIVDFALGFLGLIAVIIVIYGGFLYVTAAGEDEKTGKGKKAITYAAIGLLIVMGSFAFVNTIIKGATNGADQTSGGGTAITTTQGFNASAEQVKSLALEVFNGFSFLAQSTEDLKNIQNDASKDSLKPENFPNKNEIISFMSSVGSKLNTMKSKLQPFTQAESKINDALRDLATDIDILNSHNDIVYMTLDGSGKEIDCDVEKERAFLQGLSGFTEQQICTNDTVLKKGNKENINFSHPYPKGLFTAWSEISKKYSSTNSPTLYDKLITPVAASYHTDLVRIFGRLNDIYNSYKNINAIGGANTVASLAYSSMKGAGAYGYTDKITDVPGGLLASVTGWTVGSAGTGQASSVDTAGGFVIEGLKQQSVLYDQLSKLQFVQARLTADTIEGSAPLIVSFNALTTVDPAGGSVKGGNIYWDLAGTQTIDGLTSDSGSANPLYDPLTKMFTPKDGSITCDFATVTGVVGADSAAFIGNTAKHCRYDKPGTYTAAVRINSNDPSKYAPGISVITIKVLPPTTKINLDVQSTSEAAAKSAPHHVMRYDGDVLVDNQQSVQVTLTEAKGGIKFDASNTKNVKNFKWNYGDGKSDSSSSSTATHIYKESGKYEVTLEVVNLLGVKDSKVFTLEISSIAAKLRANPSFGSSINETVTFDAGDSKSDLGRIKDYAWTISPNSSQNIPAAILDQVKKDYPPLTLGGGTAKIVTHAFKYPIGYDIKLDVTDDAGNTATTTLGNYQVISKPPIAQFDFQMKDKTQPGTAYFDGNKSYDPDGTKTFDYAWSISPGTQGADWDFDSTKSNNGATSVSPVVKFKKTGNYNVTLKVTDQINSKESTAMTKTVKVDNILDIAWSPTQQVTAKLDANSKATISFKLVSGTAKTYDVDFGDGETANGNFGDSIVHDYNKNGKFTAKVTVYDANDNSNTIDRKIFISGGDKPISKISLLVNGEEVQDISEPVKVSKKDIVTFDAVDSKNFDGTTNNLKYSWDFGDGKNSSKVKATHTYKELSPSDVGYYTVNLNVYDSKDNTKSASDEAQIDVINTPPIFSSVQATPQPVENSLITPVTALMKVYGAEDADGEIVKYKWWYFDASSPDQQFGVQITNTPTAKLTIGTRGKEGDSITYGFGLEITDSDGLTYSNEEAIQNGQFSKLEVTNGANALPTAKFSVSSTSVFAGDKVTFTSSSKDPDGKISQYIWDFDGDGFFNDEPTDQASVEHVYKQMNKAGFDVRLKVIDDKGGESISDPIKVHVDSLAKPPVAGFTYESIPGSDGMKIKFTNTSTSDTTAGADILSYQWDFDTESLLPNADSNGDGLKGNDSDSKVKDPERLYTEKGTYKIKLSVVDTQGNKDEVINTIKLPLANPPTAAFKTEEKDGQILFTDTSKTDASSGSIITKYTWDFDINTDSDGDGKKDNDIDSSVKNPSFSYAKPGTYKAKLIVVDNQGGVDSITNDVKFNGVQASNGGTSSGGASNNLSAIMITDPAQSADNTIYLSGTSGTIKFDFSKSLGAIQYYSIDKNIYFDTDGDGIKDNENDFKTSLPGTWTTNFDKSWGQIAVRLTVVDANGNKNSVTREVKFKP